MTMNMGGVGTHQGQLFPPPHRHYRSRPPQSANGNPTPDAVYLDGIRVPIPPYLQASVATSSSQRGVDLHHPQNPASSSSATAAEEADAAAAARSSVLRRVSSRGIMSRVVVAASPAAAVPDHQLAAGGGGGTVGALANPERYRNAPPGRFRGSSSSATAVASSPDGGGREAEDGVRPSWRLRDRMKTVGVGIVMALNPGTDPPDIVKPHPCARLQCWMDPSSVTRARAREKIGERLEAQYARWQQQRAARPLKFRVALDPTVEDVRGLCLWLRRQARHERILLHYNGHGMPRPTANGEIWVLDRNKTEYVALSVSDLRQWTGKPTIVVLDCSSAGVLIPYLTAPPAETPISTPPRTGTPTGEQQAQQSQPPDGPGSLVMDMDTAASIWVNGTMVLCPTSDQEWLPMHPDYPADIFTSCLTTPIQMALRWFVRRNRASMGNLHPDAVDAIPGQANDRKTPLGELNWIFTAITDSIAWNVLPKPLFQRLFRQDLMVASMFRHFFLADRILRTMNCTPQSYPPIPRGVTDHPLWLAWDLACETFLFGLIKDGILGNHVVAAVTAPPGPAGGAGGAAATDAARGGNMGQGNGFYPLATTTSTHAEASGRDAGGGGPQVRPSSAVPDSGNGNPGAYHPPNRQSHQGAAANTALASAVSSPFFSEQLTGFEVWLEYASMRRGNIARLEPPEQLPVVLQVLLSQVHRVRALHLLQHFLELGPWAVNMSLSLGIFPYVMKLLQSVEYKSVLMNIWASILKFDPSCQVDLVKENALMHFIQPLAQWSNPVSGHPYPANPNDTAKQRTLAAFALAATCYKYPQAQTECLRQNLHGSCTTLLSAQIKLQQQQMQQQHDEKTPRRASNESSHFVLLSPIEREWLCFCLGNLVQACPPAQAEAYNANVHGCLLSLQRDDDDQNVRAAATYALGCLLEHAPSMAASSSSASLGGDASMQSTRMPPPSLGVPVVSHGVLGSPTPINLGPQAFVNTAAGYVAPPPFQVGGMGGEQQLFAPQQLSSATMTIPPGLSDAGAPAGRLHPHFGTAVAPGMPGSERPMGPTTTQQQVWPGGSTVGPPAMGGPPGLFGQPLEQEQRQHRHGVAPNVQGINSGMGGPGPVSINALYPPSMSHGLQFRNGQSLAGAPQTGGEFTLLQSAQHESTLHPQVPVVLASGGPAGSHFGPIIAGGGPLQMMTPPNHHPVGMPMIGSPLAAGTAIASQVLMSPIGGFQQVEPQEPRRRPTVYEDRRRLEFDLKVVDSMRKALSDGSFVVRYEAIMALSIFTEKYLQAVLVVAEDASRVSDTNEQLESNLDQEERSTEDKMRVVPLPRSVNQVIMERIEDCWAALRKVQHFDPHPRVSEAASTIVRVVHETLLDMRMERETKRAKELREGSLAGISEEGETDSMERVKSEQHFQMSSPDPRGNVTRATPSTDGRLNLLPSVRIYPLRRSASETAGRHFPASHESAFSTIPSIPIPGTSPIARVKAENLLPKSQLYAWKKSIFRSDYDHVELEDLEDPLNPIGAARSYQNRRNTTIREGGRKLADYFSGLKPRNLTQKRGGLDQIWDDEDDDDDDAEERDSNLKNELKLSEKRILRDTKNDDVKITSMLKFHTFENALVVCDNADSVSVWDYEGGQRRSSFKNGNPSGSRMTSALWMNESSSSLFLIGCDDGSARIWNGTIRENGEIARQSPTLASTFFAAPDMEAGQRGKSGLICEWQQQSGTLVCGGSSSYVRCWDMSAEKCYATFDAETEGCITTLTTAWDDDSPSTLKAFRGMGPEVIIAGHSDGTLKLFDIRMPRFAAAINNNDRGGRKRLQISTFAEHRGWIVDTSFTSYGGGCEIISGSVAGDIRAWDLRMSKSLRAVQVQRSPMTAFAIHKKVPIAASGSHAQFIKILTLEGETLQVVRFHEEKAGHRIGPVSCLEFHKQKLVLAAGSSNALVSIYQPRQPLKL